MSSVKRKFATSILMLLLTPMSYAGILASSTRIIFAENNTEKSLMLANTNPYPILTQIWVDEGQMDSEFKASPFVVIPSVFKLAEKETKGIRIVYNGMPLATDRESMYWLNLYEIPAVKKSELSDEYLNLAMNTQLKVFYRPKHLAHYSLNELQQQVTYKLLANQQNLELEIKNPTPYYLNFLNISLSNTQSSTDIQHTEDNILPPFSKKNYQLSNNQFQKSTNNTLKYFLIDDTGKPHQYSLKID